MEDLDKQIQEISKKLQERDEMTRKEAEKEWRKAMEHDTAGHMLGVFQLAQAQLANIQAQIDATNPLAPVIRGIAALDARVATIEAVFLAEIKKKEAEKP